MLEFKWDDSYSVDNDEIDGHHKKLIALFNEVAKLVEQDKTAPLFSSIRVISELNVYAIFHFQEEEKLMETGGYPDLDNHKELHQSFIKQIEKFKEDYLNNDPLVNYEIFSFLSDWIIKHIINQDSQYMPYI